MTIRACLLSVLLAAATVAACGGTTSSGTGGVHCTGGDCGGAGTSGGSHSGGAGAGGAGGVPPNGGAGGVPPETGGASAGAGGSLVPGCTLSNGGVEICDGIDNDCDGNVDEPKTPTHPTGVDFADVQTCGNCQTNCLLQLAYATVPQCYPPNPVDGTTAGTCDYQACADGYYDVDGFRTNGCEYACPWNPGGLNLTDLGGPDACGRDDDCNGKIDDGLEFCDDVRNCGACGFSCTLPHADATKCVTQAASPELCDTTNTHCEVLTCAPGWSNANGFGADGCEQGPPPPGPGPELCDGYDNDGDGSTDEPGAPPDGIDGTANPGDPTVHIGDSCGSSVGECNPGKWQCIAGEFTCVGWDVPKTEVCDGLDNDCDGTVDNIPVNGALCAATSECVKTATGVFECAEKCKYGSFQCPLGLVCATVESSTHPGQTDRRCIP